MRIPVYTIKPDNKILHEGENGATIRVAGTNDYWVVVRRGLTAAKNQEVLCHELGHIALGHMQDSVFPYLPEKQREKEAELFAEFVLPLIYQPILIGGANGGKLIDLTGQRFGRLTVVSRAENTASGKVRWNCLCDCGAKTTNHSHLLKSGQSKSCGCLQKESVSKSNTKHGDSFNNLYHVWRNMLDRVNLQSREDYKHYGGRGITVCNDWYSYDTFKKWALSSGYAENLTLDRENNNKGYSPDNCRWVTMKRQNNNRRNNRIIEYNGEIKTLSEWADTTQIPAHVLKQRLNKLKWSVEKTLSTPARKKNNRQ